MTSCNLSQPVSTSAETSASSSLGQRERTIVRTTRSMRRRSWTVPEIPMSTSGIRCHPTSMEDSIQSQLDHISLSALLEHPSSYIHHKARNPEEIIHIIDSVLDILGEDDQDHDSYCHQLFCWERTTAKRE